MRYVNSYGQKNENERIPCDCHAFKLLPVVVDMAKEIMKNKNIKKIKP
jgi:hypothetical protein